MQIVLIASHPGLLTPVACSTQAFSLLVLLPAVIVACSVCCLQYPGLLTLVFVACSTKAFSPRCLLPAVPRPSHSSVVPCSTNAGEGLKKCFTHTLRYQDFKWMSGGVAHSLKNHKVKAVIFPRVSQPITTTVDHGKVLNND